jgi:hypothetical protein
LIKHYFLNFTTFQNHISFSNYTSNILYVSLPRDGWRQPQGLSVAIITTATLVPSLFEPAPCKGHIYESASPQKGTSSISCLPKRTHLRFCVPSKRDIFDSVSLPRDGWRQPQDLSVAIITTATLVPSLFEPAPCKGHICESASTYQSNLEKIVICNFS